VRLALPLLLAGGPPGCGGAPDSSSLGVPDASPGGWETGSAEDVGLDAGRLGAMVERIRSGSEGPLHSVLIVRHGRLAVEEYFGPSSVDDVHSMQSVTKSVTSLLVGITLDDRRLPSEDTPVLDALPRYADLKGDPWRDALTVMHLLSMRSDLAWREEPYAGSDLEALNGSTGDWVRFVLDRPLLAPPGSEWQYDSGGVIVLGAVIRAAEDEDVVAFARRRLFAPLGIERDRWFRSPYDGLPHTGGGLYLRARDMARLGQLVLQGGAWGGRPVVSQAWLDKSAGRVTGPLTFWRHPVYYGLLWWLFPMSGRVDPDPAEPDIVTASGAGGQWIFVVRALDMVVTFTADPSNADFLRPVDLLYEDILPSVGD
jgi:CubicO group peptidase (beta-lactamase class C family)